MKKIILLQFIIILIPAFCFAQAFTPPDPGDKAPDFTLKDMSGRRIKLSDSWKVDKKKVVILSFYSYACKPCIKDLKFLQNLEKKYGSRGLRVFVVSVDSACGMSNRKLKENRITFPLFCDEYRIVAKRYGQKFLPENYIIDMNGVFVKKFAGAKENVMNNLRAKVLAMLGEKQKTVFRK